MTLLQLHIITSIVINNFHDPVFIYFSNSKQSTAIFRTTTLSVQQLFLLCVFFLLLLFISFDFHTYEYILKTEPNQRIHTSDTHTHSQIINSSTTPITHIVYNRKKLKLGKKKNDKQ